MAKSYVVKFWNGKEYATVIINLIKAQADEIQATLEDAGYIWLPYNMERTFQIEEVDE